MESTSTECKDAKDGQQRPKRNLEDQMVSTYLEGRSEIYRDLMKVQDDVSGFKSPKAWYSFTKFSSRGGTIPKLTPTSKGNVIQQTMQHGMNARLSSI